MDRTGPAFKDDLRGADLLLVDDVHFIGGKKSSQDELFHTLAALTGEGRRVVFSADRPPSALAEVDAAPALAPAAPAWSAASSRPTDRCAWASWSASWRRCRASSASTAAPGPRCCSSWPTASPTPCASWKAA